MDPAPDSRAPVRAVSPRRLAHPAWRVRAYPDWLGRHIVWRRRGDFRRAVAIVEPADEGGAARQGLKARTKLSPVPVPVRPPRDREVRLTESRAESGAEYGRLGATNFYTTSPCRRGNPQDRGVNTTCPWRSRRRR